MVHRDKDPQLQKLKTDVMSRMSIIINGDKEVTAADTHSHHDVTTGYSTEAQENVRRALEELERLSQITSS
jgi:hypothetical protein